MKSRINIDEMNLAQQSLLLISTLLCGECIFVMALFFQVQSASAEAHIQSHLNEIVKRSQMMLFMVHDYLQALEGYALTKSDSAAHGLETAESKLKEESSWLKDNLKTDYPDLSERAANLQKIYFKLFKMSNVLKDMVPGIEKERVPIFFMAVLKKVEPIRHHMERDSVRLLSAEETLLKALPEQQAETRERLRLIIYAGLATNAMIVFGLTAFFLRRIAGRLKLLVENTHKLGEGGQMSAVLSGKDELAQLDQSMHAMAEAISTARKERQEFLAMVSHELRTPLTSIRGSLELLSMGAMGGLERESGNEVQDCERDLDKLIGLINDLLDLEKLESGRLQIEKRTLYLDDVLEDALEEVAAVADEKDIEILKAEPLSEIDGDQARLKQIFVILMDNAIRYSPEASRITLDVQEADSKVQVDIIDHGPGVPAALVPQLFQRFRKGSDSPEGVISGMGLPIARHLVQLHAGSISYAPGKDGGSIFSVVFPLSMPPI